MKHLFALLLTLTIGCATTLYDRDYTIIQGTLAAVPIVDKKNERMTFYLHTTEGTYIAIAENRENFDLLESLAHRLNDNKATVYLFCEEAGEEWREYVDSVDYEVFGVGYYDYYAARYVTVITTYGNSFTDVLRSQDWTGFVTSLVKKGVDTAL